VEKRVATVVGSGSEIGVGGEMCENMVRVVGDQAEEGVDLGGH